LGKIKRKNWSESTQYTTLHSLNKILAFKETLDSKQEEKPVAAHLAATKQLLEDAKRPTGIEIKPSSAPPSYSSIDLAESHEKTTKRSMLDVEIASKKSIDRRKKDCTAALIGIGEDYIGWYRNVNVMRGPTTNPITVTKS
jgi:hypothetical protein